MSKAVLYARVSSQKQAAGLATQLKLLAAYANANRYEVVREYADVGNGRETVRTNFEEMVRYLERNPEVHLALVEKLDRLYCLPNDWLTIDELNREIHLVRDGVVLSRSAELPEKLIYAAKLAIARAGIEQ